MTETTTPQAAFPLVETKLSPPALRPGTVSRRVLLNRLRASADLPVVTISGPAGFGKTTLAAQWAAREKRPVAWATANRRDNDPVVLLTYVATGLARVGLIAVPAARPVAPGNS